MDYIDWISSFAIFILVIITLFLAIPSLLPNLDFTQNNLIAESAFSEITQTIDTYKLHSNQEYTPFFIKDVNSRANTLSYIENGNTYGVFYENANAYSLESINESYFNKEILILEESFSDNNYSDNFSLSSGNIAIEENKLRLEQNSVTETNNNYFNFKMNLEFTGNDLNIITNYQDSSNYVLFEITNEEINIYENSSSTLTLLNTKEINLQNTSKLIEVISEKEYVNIKIEEYEENYIFSSELEEGKIRFIGIDNNSTIDDISIYKIPYIKTEMDDSLFGSDIINEKIYTENLILDFNLQKTQARLIPYQNDTELVNLDFTFDENMYLPNLNGKIPILENESYEEKLIIFPETKEFWIDNTISISFDLDTFKTSNDYNYDLETIETSYDDYYRLPFKESTNNYYLVFNSQDYYGNNIDCNYEIISNTLNINNCEKTGFIKVRYNLTTEIENTYTNPKVIKTKKEIVSQEKIDSQILLNDSKLDYWIENNSNDNYYIWTKVSVPANQTKKLRVTKNIGKSPNGYKVFEMFDDFDKDYLDLYTWSSTFTDKNTQNSLLELDEEDKYTLNKNYIFEDGIIEFKSLTDSSNAKNNLTIKEKEHTKMHGYLYKYTTGGDYLRLTYRNPFTYDTIEEYTYNFTENINYNLRLDFIDNNYTGYINATQALSGQDNTYEKGLIGFNTQELNSGSFFHDYIFVRKYIDTEPTITVTDKDIYYEVEIINNSENNLENYQIKIPNTTIGVTSKTENLEITPIGEEYNLKIYKNNKLITEKGSFRKNNAKIYESFFNLINKEGKIENVKISIKSN